MRYYPFSSPKHTSKELEANKKGFLESYHNFVSKQKAKALLKVKVEKKPFQLDYFERLMNLDVLAHPFGYKRNNYTKTEITNKLENL